MKGLLTIKDVAGLLQVKPSTLYAWVAQGRIPYVKLHGAIRFLPDDVEEWVQSLRQCEGRLKKIREFVTKSPLDVDALIARAKNEVYTACHGETRPKSGSIGKEVADGAV